MTVFRLSKGLYLNDLSGRGAELVGGRWNSKGIPLLYTAGSRALCTLELAVHLPLNLIPTDYWLVTLEFPDSLDLTAAIEVVNLPSDWQAFPHPASTRQFGDGFVLANQHLVLQVPSAIVAEEFNFLLNPRHTRFSEVKIVDSQPFEFDERLFVR